MANHGKQQRVEIFSCFVLFVFFLPLNGKCHDNVWQQDNYLISGAHEMEPPSPLISWVNPFPSRFINRTIFFCNALESHECACCLLSFLYFDWLFPLSARETSPGNRSIYKSTWERVDSNGLCGRCRLHLMGSCSFFFSSLSFIKFLGN